MVTRLPGTFGSACEEIGSTTSCVEPAESLFMHSGSITAEIAAMVDGSILPMTKAQARPVDGEVKRAKVALLR